MSNISGIANEKEFVKYLNRKRVGELNPLFHEMIDKLYANSKENYIIRAWLNKMPQKADFFIKLDGKIKGIKNSVHVEGISQFTHFLIENNIPREVVIYYLHYHYADGTTNGTGKIRISVEEYKKEHQHEIDKINEIFNNDDLLMKAIERIILSKKSCYSTAVHFGPITCKPKNRCLNYNSRYEHDRFSVQLKWYNIQDDIIELMNEKCYDNCNK